MNVLIPSQLRDYTEGRAYVEARGATLAELLADLERSYPGIRFRSRRATSAPRSPQTTKS